LLTVVSRRDTELVLKKEGGTTTVMKKRLILVIAAMAAVLVMASGAALAIDQAKASHTKEKTTQKEEKTIEDPSHYSIEGPTAAKPDPVS
jgi:flagellar basal body-associated protein FliL